MMRQMLAFLSGSAGCIVFALAIIVWLHVFLMAEEHVPIFICLVTVVGLGVAANMLKVTDAVRTSLAEHERLWNLCALAVPLALIWLFREDHYNLFLIGAIMVYAVAVLGLNVQLGYAGVINFSCASFFGIGAYTSTMLMTGAGLPPLAALLLGGVMAALVGCILIFPVLRTSGHYAALVTMAFALLFKVFMDVNDFFGGPQGITVPPMTLFGIDFSHNMLFGDTELSFYLRYDLLCLLLLGLAFCFVRRLERSWIGLSMDAVRSDDTASACFGINISRWKITAFVVGNCLSGLAGALYAMMQAYISPANFTFSDSLLFLSILLLGGIGNMWGVILATVFVVLIPEKFQVIQEFRYLIYSGLVLLMIIFSPKGLLPRQPRSYS
ncbi:MAG: branched-chain amino acid ABC transporter permease [Desulfovibrio sp.]|jgi:ABC-type branched-subunit amino acid transport system permease subunit|nr:branched-chain amino acid ABC transporter permease [Desulfovibrio sp.]